MKYYSMKARQAGMTLIELTVVLLVLIGLAGLMIPYVAGFVSKTHDAVGDNSIASLNRTIQRFQGTAMKYPNDLQALADSTGTAYNKLMNTSVTTDNTASPKPYATKVYTVGTDTTPISSLTHAGITSIMGLNSNPVSATFDAAGTPIDLTSTGNKVPALLVHVGGPEMGQNYNSIEEHLADATGMQASKFNATCNDYVIMGIGQESEMVGKAMTDAPVHFAQNGNMGPDYKYNRFVAVFEVDRQNGTVTTMVNGSVPVDAQGNALTSVNCGTRTHKAKFIGTAMLMMPPHLWGLAYSQGHTYNNIANGN